MRIVAADIFNRSAIISKLGREGVTRPLSTEDMNPRLNG